MSRRNIIKTCKLCESIIPYRTHRDINNDKCVECGIDICYRCRIKLSRRIKFKSYEHVDVSIGSMCLRCCKKKKIKIKPQYTEKRKQSLWLRRMTIKLFGKGFRWNDIFKQKPKN